MKLSLFFNLVEPDVSSSNLHTVLFVCASVEPTWPT